MGDGRGRGPPSRTESMGWDGHRTRLLSSLPSFPPLQQNLLGYWSRTHARTRPCPPARPIGWLVTRAAGGAPNHHFPHLTAQSCHAVRTARDAAAEPTPLRARSHAPAPQPLASLQHLFTYRHDAIASAKAGRQAAAGNQRTVWSRSIDWAPPTARRVRAAYHTVPRPVRA